MTELLDLVARQPLFVLSPHLDDGVLSAYALLASHPSAELITVFTAPSDDGRASEWDTGLGFRSSRDAMATRIAEDRAAAELLRVRIRHLGLREFAYRSPSEEAGVRDALRTEIESIIDANPDGLVLAVPAAMGREPSPLRRLRRSITNRIPIPGLRLRPGDGSHPDHRLVFTVALATAIPRGVLVVVYEDLPYANAGGGDHIRALGRDERLLLRRYEVPIDLDAKEPAVRIYSSQCPELLPRWTDEFAAGFDPVERYWTVTTRATLRPSTPEGAEPRSSS